MSDQSSLFDLGPAPPKPCVDWPAWYTPSKDRKRANALVARGAHPFGLRLVDATRWEAGATCGSCKHKQRWSTRARNTFLKCAVSNMTRGAATDVRARWRGCEKWEQST